MVKEKIIKRVLDRGNGGKAKKRRVFNVTSFTRLRNSEKFAGAAQFCISSRSVGVSRSQKRNKKNVITQKRTVKKQHFQYNFTRCSQIVNGKTEQ